MCLRVHVYISTIMCYNKWCILCEEMQCTDHFWQLLSLVSVTSKMIYFILSFPSFWPVWFLILCLLIHLCTCYINNVVCIWREDSLITFCNYYHLYHLLKQSLVKFIYSGRFHDFDLLSVLSCCVVFVQSIVITPKRPRSLRSTLFFCVLHFRCMFYEPRPLWIAWEVG